MHIAQLSMVLNGAIGSGKGSLFLNVSLSHVRESRIFLRDTAYLWFVAQIQISRQPEAY